MKKKVLIVVIVCVCLSLSGALAYSKLQPIKGESEFESIGKNMQASIKTLLNADASGESYPIAIESNKNETDNIGEILGIKISKNYFNVRYASYEASPLGYENPREEAWESIKREVWERNFAEENNLMPTKDESEEISATILDENYFLQLQ